MANIVLIDQEIEERKQLSVFIHEAVAFYSNDYLYLLECGKIEEAEKSLRYNKQLDMAILELLGKPQIDYSITLRERYDTLSLMLIADNSISPMSYLNPKIRPSSLLLRPHNSSISNQIIREFISDYYRLNKTNDEDVLIIENRDGKTIVPFSQIYYIEVREKKIYVRLQNKEYTKYDSLNNIMSVLPDNFIRCHRSFLFNKAFLVSVKLSENTIYLEHDISVPLSRSYKDSIKEIIYGRK